MRKKILLVFLILLVPLFIISCKKADNSSPVVLNNVDINALSNNDLLSIIDDKSLSEGVYLIDTKSNSYVYFNGIKNSYIDIVSTLENKTLIINAQIDQSDGGKKLYLIKEKNTTSSDEKSHFYDTVQLMINDKESHFQSVMVIG